MTIIKVVCAWCGKDMGEKDGEGQEGVSHGICQECYERRGVMERLNFTGGVLGAKAYRRLKEHEVTQTIRAGSSSFVLAVNDGRVKPGEQIQLAFDDEFIGYGRFSQVDKVAWKELTQEDALRGGFDNRTELANALMRAGYRFYPLGHYVFYRVRFTWLDKEEVSNEPY